MKVCSICHERHDDSTACEVDLTLHESRENEPNVPGFRLDVLLSSAHHTETYRACDVASGRTCVIKIVEADEASGKDAIREAKIAANLFHPALANFYDSGRLEDGRCFFVFEDVEGRSLRELIDNDGVPDLLDTIEIIREAAEALHALHRSGIIHGSIHPRNIILSITAGGQTIVRVTDPDFGRLAQRSIISNRFLIDNELDALCYFAPEQCRGEDATVQSDVYSLGIVFYEMLAGVPPFHASTAVGLIQQHLNALPPDIRIEDFNLRMLVTHALTEALQKQERLRQPTIHTFARQLRHIEQLATHESTPPPAGTVRTEPAGVVPVSPKAAATPRKIDNHSSPRDLETINAPEPDEPVMPEVVVTEVMNADLLTAVVRARAISLEDALEEDRAMLTGLETPPVQSASVLQTWKEKLQGLTAKFAIGKSVADRGATLKAVKGHNPLASQYAELLTEAGPVRRGGKRIQSDDAMPSLEDSETALATEAPASISEFAPAALDTEIQAPPRKPTKIDWFQTDDDIPSLDDVREVLAKDNDLPVSSTIDTSVEFTDAASQSRPPKKIECSQSDDDIPSIDEVREVLAREDERSPANASFAFEAEPVAVAAVETEELLVPEVQIVRAEVVETFESERQVIPVETAGSKEHAAFAPTHKPEPDRVQAELELSAIDEAARRSLRTESEITQCESAADQPVELVAEQPEPARIVIKVPNAARRLNMVPASGAQNPQDVPDLKQFAVAAVQKRRKKISNSKSHEGDVAAPELISDSSSVPEPIELELNLIRARSTQLATPEESAERVEQDPPASNDVDTTILKTDSESLPHAVKPSAVVAIRKRHKKLMRKQPVRPVVGNGPDMVGGPTTREEEVIETPTQTIHVEPLNSEPQEIIVEPPIAVQEPYRDESGVVASRVETQGPHDQVSARKVPTIAFVARHHKHSSHRTSPVAASTPIADDEEITIVRPPRRKRVRIHVNTPSKRPLAVRSKQPLSPVPSQVEFFPTLLGGSIEQTSFTTEKDDGMFAAFSANSSGVISRHRSHVIGGGIIAMLALLLYGSDLLPRYLQSFDSTNSMTAEATRREETKPLSTTAKPVTVDAKAVVERPVGEKKDRSAAKSKDSISSGTTNAIPHESLTRILIQLPSRAPELETIPPAVPSAKRKATAAEITQPKAGTRPRVVKDPQP